MTKNEHETVIAIVLEHAGAALAAKLREKLERCTSGQEGKTLAAIEWLDQQEGYVVDSGREDVWVVFDDEGSTVAEGLDLADAIRNAHKAEDSHA